MRTPLLLSSLLAVVCASAVAAQGSQAKCLALASSLPGSLENTTILSVSYVAAASTISTPGMCQSSASVPTGSAPFCRIGFVVNTTATSAVHAEAWLPDTWFGRLLGLGNGGFGGCIDYTGLAYGTSLHFASVGSDNGHDGNSGSVFLNAPEVINDFAFRAVHVEAVIGKQLAAMYYGSTVTKSYFEGCSTGGRQAAQAALVFPDDFDGILGGSAAIDWNHLQGWSGLLSHFVGSPNFQGNPKFLQTADWATVSAAILAACDGLDGLVDGIVSDPDECEFDIDALECPTGNGNTTGCLTATQVQTVKNVYTPMFSEHGKLLYPRYAPGSEADSQRTLKLGGPFFEFTQEWEMFATLNVTSHDFTNFSLADVALMERINAGGIRTFSGDLSAFRARGGKFLAYHGARDPRIPITNSKRFYALIQETLRLAPPQMDGFYRLFGIPGMGHCGGGVVSAATRFGQGTAANSNAVNDSAHNALLALVDWVEGGTGPDTIIGMNSAGAERVHCRVPMRSQWDADKGAFICVSV